MNPLDTEDHLSALLEISRAINSILSTQPLLDKIMDIALSSIGAERGFILLKDENSGKLEMRVKRNIIGEEAAPTISSTIVEQAMASGEPVLVHDAKEDPRFSESSSVIIHNILSAACVPLKLRDRTMGAIYVDSTSAKSVFTGGTIRFLSGLADQAAIALENARMHEKVVDENALLRREIANVSGFESILGTSQRMQSVYSMMRRVIPISSSVLIEGESGTGKELVARAIHYTGPRKSKAFVAQQCSAIPESLLESELFGHAQGAFTGAKADKKGLFEAADGGTFFLDEVADISTSIQAKLLRVLQEGEVRRVGETEPRKVDVRIISATNRNLKAEVDAGDFREDLYYRLKVITINLPPLRERPEDIPLLVDHFVKEFAQKCAKRVDGMEKSSIDILMTHGWPGNVRELKNTIERAVILCSGGTITPADIMLETESQVSGSLKDHEKQIILNKLRELNGNRTKTAKALGISVRTLQNKLKRWKAIGI